MQPVSMRDAAVANIISLTLEWLAQRPVRFPVPEDFSGTRAEPVRGEIPPGKRRVWPGEMLDNGFVDEEAGFTKRRKARNRNFASKMTS